jgi:Zn-dependent peptidase ImmA (M78 family)
VRREESEDQDLSGFLLRDTRRNAAVIGVNKNHHPHRQRFTIAHEIGHLLLHNVDELHVDRRDALVVQKRDGTSSTGAVLEEREANFFAAELLLPRTLLEQDLDAIAVLDDEAVKRLASRYEVSVQAMTLRLVNLGILDQ